MENLDYHEIEEFIFPAWKVIENSVTPDRLDTADVKAWTM